jgi:DNA-binding phage protein
LSDLASVTPETSSRVAKFKETARPEFDTIRKVMRSLGVKLVAEPIDEGQKVA